MNNTKLNRFVLGITSLLGGAGFSLVICFGLFPPDQKKENTVPDESASLQTLSAEGYDQNPVKNPSDLVDIVALAGSTERRFALYRLLENKNGTQVADLLQSTFSFKTSKNLFPVQRILFSELSRLDSAKALELIWETERARWGSLLEIVATQWSSIAPGEALQAFSSLTEPWKAKAIRTVLQHQGSLNEEELEEVAQSLNITDYYVLWSLEDKLAQVMDEPRTAFNLVLETDISDFQKRTMLRKIARRWIDSESTDNIGSMLSLVDEVFNDKPYSFWSAIVADVAAANPQIAWEQLLSLSEDTQARITSRVFRSWANQDSISAIKAITTPEYMESQKSEVKWLLMGWVFALSGQVLEQIDLVPEDFRSFVVNEAIRYQAQSLSPSEALDLLEQFGQRGINILEATTTFVISWSQSDPTAAVEWVIQNMDQSSSNDVWMLRFALEELALLNSTKAMEIALKQPENSGLADAVIFALARQGKIDEGLALLPQVRNTTNSYVYSSIGGSLIESGRIEDALVLGESLDETMRSEFYRRLAWPWLRFDVESLLEQLPQLENVEVRSMIATSVLQQQELYPYLSEEELEMVTALVLEESNER